MRAPDRPQLSWRGGEDDPGVERHQLRLRPSEITTIEGRPVTTLDRTLQDVARRSPFRDAVAAGDQLLRRGISDDRVSELIAGPRLRGHTRMVEVLTALDRRCTNRFESYTRLLLVTADVGPVECQKLIDDHWYDFWLPDLEALVESDGFEFHSDRAHYRRDRRVSQQANARGLNLVRLSWEDVFIDWESTIALFHWIAIAHRDRYAGAKGAGDTVRNSDTPGRNPPMAPAGEGGSHSTVPLWSPSSRAPVRTRTSPS